MPVGTPVHAARDGVVALAEDSHDVGCWREECGRLANFIVLLHADGTTGEYFHLQRGSVQVRLGQHVERGELLAFSGNTGYTTAPHLHFGVYRTERDGQTQSLAVRFVTRSGMIREPRTGARYLNVARPLIAGPRSTARRFLRRRHARRRRRSRHATRRLRRFPRRHLRPRARLRRHPCRPARVLAPARTRALKTRGLFPRAKAPARRVAIAATAVRDDARCRPPENTTAARAEHCPSGVRAIGRFGILRAMLTWNGRIPGARAPRGSRVRSASGSRCSAAACSCRPRRRSRRRRSRSCASARSDRAAARAARDAARHARGAEPGADRRNPGPVQPLRGHVLGDRSAVQPRLRGAAPGEPDRRPMVARRGDARLSADADDPPRRAARGHRHQYSRDAALLLHDREERRRSGREGHEGDDASDRHRHRRVGDAHRRSHGHRQGARSGLVRARVDSQGACGARRSVAEQGSAGARQSARQVRDDAVDSGLLDPRHEQAGRRRHALEPRLRAPLSRGHRGAVRPRRRRARTCGS